MSAFGLSVTQGTNLFKRLVFCCNGKYFLKYISGGDNLFKTKKIGQVLVLEVIS